MKRFLFALAALIALAAPAHAQFCNDASGFLKTDGPIPLGDVLILGPDCQHAQDGGVLAANSFIFANSYGVKCDGATDDSAAMNAAIGAANGRPIYMPVGTCVFQHQLQNITGGNFLNPGLYIIGQGRNRTIFDTRVANMCLILNDTPQDGQFSAGATIRDLTITSNATPATANACGIQLHRNAYARISNVQFTGIQGDGIYIPASVGDADAFFEIVIDRVRMEGVGTNNAWCIQANAPSGGYSGSNLRIQNSTFSTCGSTSSAVPPVSGAIEYKGLIAQIINSGFTLNKNVDFYVQGADTSMQITIDGTDFENVISSALPHVYVDGGLRGFTMTNSECLNNDQNIGQGCVWFNSASAPIGNITIDKVEVRATPLNNPYVAFQTTGANTLLDTIRIRDIYWQTFDTAGQLRFSGFLFDPLSAQVRLSVTSTNVLTLNAVGYGGSVPVRLKGASGEWVSVQIANAPASATLGPLSANTTYNIYAFNSAGTNSPYVISLEANTAATSVDAVSGILVKNADTTRTFVGTSTTDGSGNFVTTLGATSSWYAPVVGSAGQFFGTGNNDDAAAGRVGEYLEQNIPIGSAIPLTGAGSGTPANVATITLTPGDWDVTGNVSYNPASTTNFTLAFHSISATSAVQDSTTGNAYSIYRFPSGNVPVANFTTAGIGPVREKVAPGTTRQLFLVAQSAFTVSTMTAYGIIRARRVR